jgi:hypothetical protein
VGKALYGGGATPHAVRGLMSHVDDVVRRADRRKKKPAHIADLAFRVHAFIGLGQFIVFLCRFAAGLGSASEQHLVSQSCTCMCVCLCFLCVCVRERVCARIFVFVSLANHSQHPARLSVPFPF